VIQLVFNFFFALQLGAVCLKLLLFFNLGEDGLFFFFLLLKNIILELVWVVLHLSLEGIDVLTGTSVLSSDLVEHFSYHLEGVDVRDFINLTFKEFLCSFLDLSQILL
jgi:hypothetical protein